MAAWLACLQGKNPINGEMVQLLLMKIAYWKEVLRHIVTIAKLFSEQHLVFRGREDVISSPLNRNYIGILELITKFDLFLSEHIKCYENKGKGHTSYLSKTICDDFELMGCKILEFIVKKSNR